jgi:hypothetical protein
MDLPSARTVAAGDELRRALASDHLGHAGHHERLIVGMDEIEGRAPEDVVLALGSEQADPGRVDERDLPVLDDQDGVGGQVDEATIALLTLSERLVASPSAVTSKIGHVVEILHPNAQQVVPESPKEL